MSLRISLRRNLNKLIWLWHSILSGKYKHSSLWTVQRSQVKSEYSTSTTSYLRKSIGCHSAQWHPSKTRINVAVVGHFQSAKRSKHTVCFTQASTNNFQHNSSLIARKKFTVISAVAGETSSKRWSMCRTTVKIELYRHHSLRQLSVRAEQWWITAVSEVVRLVQDQWHASSERLQGIGVGIEGAASCRGCGCDQLAVVLERGVRSLRD